MSWIRNQNMFAVMLCCLAVGCSMLVATAEEKKKSTISDTKKPAAGTLIAFDEAVSQTQQKKSQQRFLPALTQRELKIQKALEEETDCDFSDEPLSEVMALFSERHGIPILVSGNDLGEEGLTLDEPVKLNVKQIALQDALSLILEPIGLTYLVEHGVLKITTGIHASDKLTSRVYPVGDLCRTVEDYLTLESALRNADLGDWRPRKTGCLSEKSKGQSQQAGSPAPAGGGFFNIPDGKFKGGESIDPLLYEEGVGGTITIVQQSHALVITQTYHAHNAIVDLLTQIREARTSE
ncbi:hypothetical protein [Gimesia sp.]|uniref:hypothetical protein n=1 Tax=Gimesia sp. TaxID=2024833 RepID=UPI003A946CA3